MSISCSLYRLTIDPILKSLRKEVAALLSENCTVIELGSGTGAQACALADRCSRYLGIDLNPGSVACAQARCKEKGFEQCEFKVVDGSSLPFLKDKEFDVGTCTLALHEMQADMRLMVLKELQRVSKKLIVIDYASPLPHSFAGKGAWFIEKLAGGDHYAGFMEYQHLGGVLPLLKIAGCSILSQQKSLWGIVSIVISQD
ncbi:methylase involved in ubiquinone/menaquinone biosynthesis [Sphaerochaeta pleomorpha str. Grapes]|uniref:Methylase involved in ubiquinone/menaquinone biosynthesis n=1 Tax=Sphaerochaeta pleomorpha (strain ATCC BAA-1885 / DSM 22778 / Grapes) TaxID=158190 RepID=G8QSS0_SPHPG|nr:class I SAM-dependent methyltransferase [Sphaerochaeta pleomorpha]AEV30102.1 methylase involved in ubiquinone/menaquinone biosynthesis [Sphaerochaeta pleomorpha str. Grapes]